MNDPIRIDEIARRRLLFTLTALAFSMHQGLASAQEQPAPPPLPPDTSTWKCSVCPADAGNSGYIDAGILGAYSNNDQYGAYAGLKHDGGYPLIDGLYRYRGEDARYFDLQGSTFNLDSQRAAPLAPSLSIDGGKQGLFELKGSYQEIPRYPYVDALTPFLGAGGSHQTLPAGWIAAGSTQQMTKLPESLRNFDVREKRQIARAEGRFLPPESHWKLDVTFRHDKQSGEQVSGANFLTTTSLLASPVHYATDQIDAGAQYAGQNWQIRFGYYGSFFHNADSAVTWDNPFTPFVAGANVGRMSVAPDNNFNQFSIGGAWQILPSTRFMASFAYGEATQNESFMGSTVNPNLGTQALPRSSLDGRIDTGNYTLRLTSRPLDHLSLTLDYVDDRRDNKTAQSAYQQVVTDVYVASTLFNLPYSFDRATARALADVSMGPAKLELGVKDQHYDTTYQEVARTSTSGGWVEVRTTVSSMFGFSFKYDRSRRSINDYQSAPTIIAVENPLLQRFNLANRTRDELMGTAYFTPVQNFTFGLSAEQHKDEYDQSQVGLTGARDHSVTLNASWTPSQDASLEAYATHQMISADQAGSQVVGPPDWFAHTVDSVDSGGISGQLKNIMPKLGVGANIYVAYTRESIAMNVGYPNITPFPNNMFRDVGLRLFANYQMSTKSSLRFDYWHERYRTEDWSLDGVAPATIANALSLGIASPNFSLDQFAVSYRYDF